jgi:hypothetical protein
MGVKTWPRGQEIWVNQRDFRAVFRVQNELVFVQYPDQGWRWHAGSTRQWKEKGKKKKAGLGCCGRGWAGLGPRRRCARARLAGWAGPGRSVQSVTFFYFLFFFFYFLILL